MPEARHIGPPDIDPRPGTGQPADVPCGASETPAPAPAAPWPHADAHPAGLDALAYIQGQTVIPRADALETVLFQIDAVGASVELVAV